jgi:DnaJ-class molecular chaperone
MNPLDTLTTIGVLALIVVTIGYSLSCAIYPYRDCRSCQGAGGFRSPILRAIRLCRRCGGTGRTLRTGRRFYNTALRTNRALRNAQERDRHDNR